MSMGLDVRFEVRLPNGTTTRYVEVSMLNSRGVIYYAHTRDGGLKGARCTAGVYDLRSAGDLAWNVVRWIAAGEQIIPDWRAHEVCELCGSDDAVRNPGVPADGSPGTLTQP